MVSKGQDRDGLDIKSERTPYAIKLGSYYAAGVMGLALLCAGYAYWTHFRQAEAQFRQHVMIIRQMTSWTLGQEKQHQRAETLRAFYQLETQRGNVDQAALLVDSQIVLAHSLEWEGLDTRFITGHQEFAEQHNTSRRTGQVMFRRNTKPDRFEAMVPLVSEDSEKQAWLYLARDVSAIRQEALERFFAVLCIGTFLAIGLGLLITIGVYRALVLPLKRSDEHINEDELAVAIEVSSLGEPPLPTNQLREVLEQLRDAHSALLHVDQPESAKAKRAAHDPQEEPERSNRTSQTAEPPPKTRMSGAVLVVGRNDDLAHALTKETLDLGLGVVWVPDFWAADVELGEGQYDLVIINLAWRDRDTMALLDRLRERCRAVPLIALLSAPARNEERIHAALQCDDYLYAPITRPGVLAIIGKYLDFKPIQRKLTGRE